MYKNILVGLDNSDHSIAGCDIALAVGAHYGAQLTGCHVYAANLHNTRFRQMEGTLPEQYRAPAEIERQREVHQELITRGLEIISDAYMAVFSARARSFGITARELCKEGKNYEEIVKEASSGGYGLVVLGAFGLGKTSKSRIGSVAERVTRRAVTDTLVIRDTAAPAKGARIIAAIDGSARSYGALLSALDLSAALRLPVEAVSVYDPDFHYTAFRSIAGVLSEEAGNLFRFKDQEKLHNEIIDRGLARIYQAHLDTSVRLAALRGHEITTVLLAGKPCDEITRHALCSSAFLITVGKTGVHAADSLDIGSNTENCLREAPCNVLVSSREAAPDAQMAQDADAITWEDGAARMLERIPAFARGIARNMAEDAAKKAGLKVVTAVFMRSVRKDL